MPKRDDGYMEGRRHDILAVTQTLIAEHGLAATTTTLICREAGISMGALYTHFKSRDDIIAAMADHYTAQVREAVTFASPAEMRRKLHARLRRFTDRTSPHATAIELQLLAAAISSEPLRRGLVVNFKASRDAMIDSLGRLQDQGDIPPGADLRTSATLVENFMYGVLYRLGANASESRRDQQRALDALIDQVLAGPISRPAKRPA